MMKGSTSITILMSHLRHIRRSPLANNSYELGGSRFAMIYTSLELEYAEFLLERRTRSF